MLSWYFVLKINIIFFSLGFGEFFWDLFESPKKQETKFWVENENSHFSNNFHFPHQKNLIKKIRKLIKISKRSKNKFSREFVLI